MVAGGHHFLSESSGGVQSWESKKCNPGGQQLTNGEFARITTFFNHGFEQDVSLIHNPGFEG